VRVPILSPVNRARSTAAALTLTLTACAAPTVSTVSQPPADFDTQPEWTTTLPAAVALNVASNGDVAVIAWTTDSEVLVADLDPVTGELGKSNAVNGSQHPVAHPIERPALAVRTDGTVDFAFTGHQGEGASVFYGHTDQDVSVISGIPRHETNLVHATLGAEGLPVLSWLEESTLSVAVDTGSGPVEVEGVDDLTCDCCNPAPLVVGDNLAVAFRDFEQGDQGIVRNVVAVSSDDSGETFGSVVAIADDDWFIDACPFSGPSALVADGDMVVAWMDARQSVHPDQGSSSIWVDRSEDGGATFGADLEVSGEGIHRWPVMAIDENGVIYLVWETQGIDGGLSYTRSSDGGRSFEDPSMLVSRELNDGGAPVSPSVAIHKGLLVVSWADSSQGHVGVWDLGGG